MSNNLRLEVLLKAVDQATRPLKSIQTASKTLSGDIRDTQKGLRDLNGQAAKIDGFRKTSAQLAVTGQSLEKAKREAEALATQFKILSARRERRHRCSNPQNVPPRGCRLNTTASPSQLNANNASWVPPVSIPAIWQTMSGA